MYDLKKYRAVGVLIWFFVLQIYGQMQLLAAVPKPVLVLREGLDGAINEWSGPAKFVLYNDGTVITETSNETSENSGERRYYRTQLSTVQSSKLMESLSVKKIISRSKHQYGQGVGAHNEGISWQLIYWGQTSQFKITIVGSLDQAPKNIVKLVRNLEKYPKNGKRYLDFDYILSFCCAQNVASLPWPKDWSTFNFSKEMLKGYSAPDLVYEYRLDAPRALQLIEKMAKAKTQYISINGFAWRLRLSPAPKVPNDLLWVRNPI